MENMKLKLANNILIEIDAIKECENVNGSLTLAELMTRDALKLAQIIVLEEERKKRMKILLIDDIRNEDYIQSTYGERPTKVVRTYDEAIEALKEGNWDLVYLDHDLGDYQDGTERTGYTLMNFLESNQQYLPKNITFVTANPVGRQQMMSVYRKLYV